MTVRIVLIAAIGLTTPALAQQPPLAGAIDSAWTSNESGAQMSNFRARVAGGQCVATMNYKMPSGYAGKTQWTFTAEAAAGYTRCTRGQWQDLSGSDRTGQRYHRLQGKALLGTALMA